MTHNKKRDNVRESEKRKSIDFARQCDWHGNWTERWISDFTIVLFVFMHLEAIHLGSRPKPTAYSPPGCCTICDSLTISLYLSEGKRRREEMRGGRRKKSCVVSGTTDNPTTTTNVSPRANLSRFDSENSISSVKYFDPEQGNYISFWRKPRRICLLEQITDDNISRRAERGARNEYKNTTQKLCSNWMAKRFTHSKLSTTGRVASCQLKFIKNAKFYKKLPRLRLD